MKTNKTRSSAKLVKAFKTKPKQNNLNPEQLRDNDAHAQRAKTMMDVYSIVYSNVHDEADYIMHDFLTDLMHLCDRDSSWGGFDARLSIALMQHKTETEGE